MMNDRNLTRHTYRDQPAQEVATRILDFGAGSKKYELVASTQSAWAFSEKLDDLIRYSLEVETQLVIMGKFENGDAFQVNFPVKGFHHAINMLNISCISFRGKDSPILDTPSPATGKLPEYR